MKTDIQNSIKKVTLSDDKSLITAEVYFDPSLPFFAGHFPGHPLLPGIFQIALVRKIVKIALKGQYHVARIINAKFLNEILPGMVLTLTIDLPKDNLLRVAALLRHEKAVVAKISLTLE